MTTAERSKALSDLLAEHECDKSLLRPMDSRQRWLGRVVPLLSFSPILHQNAVTAADILVRPGFSGSAYEQMEGRMLFLVRQGIMELDHDLTPWRPKDEEKKGSEEHTLWRWWELASLQERFGMLGFCAGLFMAGFLCAQIPATRAIIHFIRQLIP